LIKLDIQGHLVDLDHLDGIVDKADLVEVVDIASYSFLTYPGELRSFTS
jgi:hypothetical protein